MSNNITEDALVLADRLDQFTGRYMLLQGCEDSAKMIRKMAEEIDRLRASQVAYEARPLREEIKKLRYALGAIETCAPYMWLKDHDAVPIEPIDVNDSYRSICFNMMMVAREAL